MDPNTPQPTNQPPQDSPDALPVDAPQTTEFDQAPVDAPAESPTFGETPVSPESEPAVGAFGPAPASTDATAGVFGASSPAVDASTPSATPLATEQPNPFGPAPDAAVTPVVPVAPIVPGAPVPTAMPPAKPGNGKKIAIIGGIVGGVILLAIAGIVVFLLLTTVSKQDYADAAKQYNATSIASSTLTTKASTMARGISTSTDTDFNTKVAEIDEAITKLEQENDKLGALKATRVGEGKEVYDTFDKKLGEYLEYAKGIVASVKSVRPALVKCGSISSVTDVSARVAAVKDCSTSLNAVTDLPNPEFKTYVDSLKTGYAEFATTYESISKLTSPYGSQYEQFKVLRDKMYDTQDAITTAGKTFTTALNTRDDEVSVKDSADALGKFLTDKQR